MTTYYLTKEDLLKICIFNGVFSEDVSYNYLSSGDTSKDFFDEYIIRNLLYKNPLLQKDFDNLTKDNKSIHINSFIDIFDGKIKSMDFYDTIFGTSYCRVKDKDSKRINFFKKLFESDSSLILELHDKLKKSDNGEDFALHDAYFQILKTKKAKELNIDHNEIRTNIDKFSTNLEFTYCKKKINAYLNNFPKDINLYNHIIKNLDNEINRMGSVRVFLEEKISLFPQKVIDKHHQELISLSPFTEEKNFHYSIKINAEYLISNFKKSQTEALEIKKNFHIEFSEFLCNKFKNCNRIKMYQGIGVNLIFQNEKDRDEAIHIFSLISQDFDSLFGNANTSPGANYFTTYLERLEALTKLNNELDINQGKTKKNKI
ncbi:hypothetical protein GW796_08655 [archaeon]|nr:hypothetical protein [archaeon]NCQ51949.1 hypothetical protein [archaeon]